MLELEPFTMNYSGANAYALADACMRVASRSERDALEKSAEKWALKWISEPDQLHRPLMSPTPTPMPQVLIASNDDAIVAVFHEPEDEPLVRWTSWPEANMTSPPPTARFGTTSSAWGLNESLQNRFKNVWQKTYESLHAARRRSIFLTGHGVGGAYALLAALELRSADEVVHGVYTFGQPRVLCRDLALWLNLDFGAHIFRFVNNNDLVTLCPFRKYGYGHAGTLVFFDAAGQLHSDRYWWFRLLSEFDEASENELPRLMQVTPSGVRDHMIERYVELTLRHRDHGLRP